jgi:hypothetical protein
MDKLRLVLVNSSECELDTVNFDGDGKNLTDRVLEIIWDRRWTLHAGDTIRIEVRP